MRGLIPEGGAHNACSCVLLSSWAKCHSRSLLAEAWVADGWCVVADVVLKEAASVVAIGSSGLAMVMAMG